MPLRPSLSVGVGTTGRAALALRLGKAISFAKAEGYEYGECYKQFQVEAFNDTGSSVELEVIDLEASELRTFEMD